MSNARLIAALEEAARNQPIRLPLEWYFPTSLRAEPQRADMPSEPVSGPVAVPKAQVPAPVVASEGLTAPEAVPVWQIRADISVWRSR